MKVSMNGLRRNLSIELNTSIHAFNIGDNEELKNSLENIRSYVGALNSVYDEDDKEGFSDLSDKIILVELKEQS